MKEYIIVINGKPRAGKDTFVKFFARSLKWNKYYYRNLSSIDPVKEAMKSLGWKGEKTEVWRAMLSAVKSLWVDKVNGPFNYIVDLVKEIKDSMKKENKTGFIFIHIREPEEIKKIEDYYGGECITIFVNNKNVKDVKSNSSDAGVADYKYDYYVDNDGDLEDYQNTINEFTNFFKKE